MTEESGQRNVDSDYLLTHDEEDFLEEALNSQDVRFQIFSDTGNVFEKVKTKNIIGAIPESKLPHRKIVILICILKEISTNSNINVINMLEKMAVHLASFQSNFEECDLPALPDWSKKRNPLAFWKWRKKIDLQDLAQKITMSKELSKSISSRISDDSHRIYSMTQSAKKNNPYT